MGLNRREKWSGATGSRKALLDLSQRVNRKCDIRFYVVVQYLPPPSAAAEQINTTVMQKRIFVLV